MAQAELHTGNMQVETLSDLVIPGLGEEIVHGEGIAPLDTAFGKSYASDLAFMEEPVTIRIEPGTEENSPLVIDVYVNGVPAFIRVGHPTTVARKYVEVLARAKPMTIRTQHDTPETSPEGGPQNVMKRSVRSQYVFSVIEDKNPRGAAWLTRVLMER